MRWIPGPAIGSCYSLAVPVTIDLLEDWEPVGCRLELSVGGTNRAPPADVERRAPVGRWRRCTSIAVHQTSSPAG